MKLQERYFFYSLLAAVSVLALAVMWPFITVIIVGISLATVLHPVYLSFDKTLKRSWLSALMTIFVTILILGVPLYFAVVQVIHEATTFSISSFSESVRGAFPDLPLIDSNDILDKTVSILTGSIQSLFRSTVTTFFSGLLVFLSVFYFLKDSSYWRKTIINFSPLSTEYDERILTMLARSVRAVFEGYMLVALLQGILMGIGLEVFGIPNAALWGLVAGLASLIPSIGTALISIPAILYLFATGQVGQAIGLILWAGVLVGLLDNVLNPMLVGRNLKLPPVVMLFSVLGGVSLLGPSGIIIGPLTLSLFHTLFHIYRERFE